MLKDIANIEQARSWDGDDGEHWAANDEMYNGAVARHHAHFIAAAAIGASDRVLDIGCGTGVSTCDAGHAATAGTALGVDLSAKMLERARQRAKERGLANVTFEQADAQVHPFEQASYDIAMSRFGAMFFADPAAAFANIASAVRPGGRLVLMSWRPLDQQVWLTRVREAFAAGRDLPGEPNGRPGPFGLADPAQVRPLLEGAGFRDVAMREVDEPMRFGATADEAFAFWAGSGLSHGLLGQADEATRQRAFAALRELFARHEMKDGVLLGSAAWLTTARRA